jgi:tetratricopeptide (TPR) repeat protein
MRAGEDEPSYLGTHLERAGDEATAHAHWLDAAYHALEGSDFTLAVNLSERIVETGDGGTRAEAWYVRAQALKWRGDYRMACDAARQAVSLSPAGSASWLRACSELAALLIRIGDHDPLGELIESLLDHEPTAATRAEHAMTTCRVAMSALFAGREHDAELLRAKAQALAEDAPPRRRNAMRSAAGSTPSVRSSGASPTTSTRPPKSCDSLRAVIARLPTEGARRTP